MGVFGVGEVFGIWLSIESGSWVYVYPKYMPAFICIECHLCISSNLAFYEKDMAEKNTAVINLGYSPGTFYEMVTTYSDRFGSIC